MVDSQQTTHAHEANTRERARGGEPKLAFGSWAFSFGPFESAPWSFERLCAYAADAGYDGVEINGFRPHPHHDDFDSDARCAELRATIDDAGLVPAGYAPDFTAVPPAEVEAADYLATIDKARAFCERLGISILRVDSVSAPDALAADEYERRFQRLVTTWRAAAERCRRSGVTLVWEFEPGFWLNRPSEVLRAVQEVDDPGFRILFDTSHAYTGAVAGARQGPEPELLEGGVTEYARLLAPYVGHLHLIDSDGSLHHDETSAHLPFGTGNVDFPAALAALRPTLDGLDWWGVDFCFCPTTETDARAAIPYLHELIARTTGTAR
jgi:sugar phosphate isomerase/epimerase